MRKTVSISSLPRVAAIGVLALPFAAAAPGPALADECVYDNGTSDHGPCVQFENRLSQDTRKNFDLYCQQGPTPPSQKIIMRPGDSFTCQVKNRDNEAASTNLNDNWKSWSYLCGAESTQKYKVKLLGSRGGGRWQTSCHDLP